MANQTPSQGILVVFLKWLLEFSTIYILFCKHQLDRVACLLCGTVLHEMMIPTGRGSRCGCFEGVGRVAGCAAPLLVMQLRRG